MARVTIDLPDNLPFSMTIRTRVTDMNYGAHVGNEVFLAYAHEARVAFFESLGLSEMDLGGVGVIMADAAVVYKSEVRANENLQVSVGADDFSRLGFDLFYAITNEDTGKPVAQIKTGMVCFDYANKKVAKLPEGTKEKLLGNVE